MNTAYEYPHRTAPSEERVISLTAYRNPVDGSLALASWEETWAPRPEPSRPAPAAAPSARRRGLSHWLELTASVVTAAIAAGAWLFLMR